MSNKKVDPTIISWSLVAIFISAVMIIFNEEKVVSEAGFFTKLLAIILGSVLGTLGALMGNALRKFAQPSSFITSGGFFQIIWIKIFWKLGPQVIGLFIGIVVGSALLFTEDYNKAHPHTWERTCRNIMDSETRKALKEGKSDYEIGNMRTAVYNKCISDFQNQ